MENYQSNSKKNKAEKKEKPEIQKIVTGQIVSKPPSITSKIKGIFFGGDAREVARYVMGEVLLPAFRNLVVEALHVGTERMVFPDSSIRRRPGYSAAPDRYAPKVTYATPVNRGLPRDPRERQTGYLPEQRSSGRRRETNEINFGRLEDAEAVLAQMIDVIDQYDVVSLADLYDMVGLLSSPIDNKWGWTFLTDVDIRQTRDGFVIDFPHAEPLTY
jgi:hypothetical protein